jgi:hypothetical protein
MMILNPLCTSLADSLHDDVIQVLSNSCEICHLFWKLALVPLQADSFSVAEKKFIRLFILSECVCSYTCLVMDAVPRYYQFLLRSDPNFVGISVLIIHTSISPPHNCCVEKIVVLTTLSAATISSGSSFSFYSHLRVSWQHYVGFLLDADC